MKKKSVLERVKIVPLKKKMGVIKELVALFREGMAYFDEYEEDMVSELRDYFGGKRRDTHYFVAVLGGEIIGLIGYLRYSNDVYNTGWFCIRKDLQGHGIGSLLLKFVERDLRGKARLLMVECWDSAETCQLLKFYRERGYRPAATLRNFYDDEDGDMTFFSKRIAKK